MNVLIVGSGAREHALVWKALQSPLTEAVYCAPGNAATAAIAINVPIEVTDVEGMVRFVEERDVGLTVIGPEAAVAAGLADRLTAAGRLVFGPTKVAGQIESSKAFAKSLMTRDAEETLECIDTLMLRRTVGAAADRIVLEEKLDGREVSLLALVDGQRVLALEPVCDYKRALDGDKGPNTGGMGGYSPVSFFGADRTQQAVDRALLPVVEALRADGTPYCGCLYAGLMVGPSGLQVLEYNARFGDPETQVVMPRLQTDPIELLQAAVH